MDSAFQSAPYPGYTTAELRAFLAAGRGNVRMVREIERREAAEAGDVSVMTGSERLRFSKKQQEAK